MERLPKTLGCLLFTKAKNVDALLTDSRSKACEVAVGRDQAKAVETATVQEIHRVDYEGDVGRLLTSRVGELLLGDNRVLREHIDPGLRAGACEVAINAPNACLADLGDLLEQAVNDLCRGVVSVYQDGKSWRALSIYHLFIFIRRALIQGC